MAAPELSIIIINWNSREFLRKCLLTLEEAGGEIEYEVIVVDNASYDGCEEMISSEFAHVRFVQAGANLGFARGNNLGASLAQGKFLLFLNPDTEIKGNALVFLIETASSASKIGIVGARLLNTDNSLQLECIKAFPTVLNEVVDMHFLQVAFPRWALWGKRAFYAETSGPAEVDVVSGACMLVKRKIFERVEGFNEGYFMYSEDVDLCWKVRQFGGSVVFDGRAEIVHHGGGSSALSTVSQFSSVLMRESRFRYFAITKGKTYAVVYRSAMVLVAVLRLCVIAVAYPVLKVIGKRSPAGAINKWFSVLRWSLGFESWVKKIG